jgi:hypothetical protein
MIESRDELIHHLSAILARQSRLALKDGASIVHVEFDPSLAAAVLRHLNARNIRPKAALTARQYTHDMATNSWGNCYDPIVFLEDWSLYNGQHRLYAVMQSGTTQTFLCVCGARPDVRRGIDAGVKRSIMATHGIGDYEASITRTVQMLFIGVRYSNSTRSQIVTDYNKIQSAVDWHGQRFRSRPVLREGHVAGAFVFAELAHPEHSDDIRELATDLAVGDQGFAMSRVIANHLVQRKSLGVRVSSQQERMREAQLILRGIQVHLMDGSLSQLQGVQADMDWWLTEPASTASSESLMKAE